VSILGVEIWIGVRFRVCRWCLFRRGVGGCGILGLGCGCGVVLFLLILVPRVGCFWWGGEMMMMLVVALNNNLFVDHDGCRSRPRGVMMTKTKSASIMMMGQPAAAGEVLTRRFDAQEARPI